MPRSSAYTSVHQIPALYTNWLPESGSFVFDFGAGKYDDTTMMLQDRGIFNLVYDPYNLPNNPNEETYKYACLSGVDYVVCLNVLNVIKDNSERTEAIRKIRGLCDRPKFKMLWFQIYEGDRSGKPSVKNCQLNRKTEDYIPEIKEYFESDKFDVQWFSFGDKKNYIKVTQR